MRGVLEMPLIWTAAGLAIILIGFTFLDRYIPANGIIWNAVNGRVGGFPYRYLFALGIVLTLGGFLGWAHSTRQH